MSEELIIKRKTEEMIQYGYICLGHFPKTERHTLAAEIKTAMFQVLRLIITTQKRYHKKTTLSELDIALELLKSLVRLAKDLTFLPFRQYEHWQRQNAEIGKMLGGWIKSANASGQSV